ncbi:MAG TPA: hypothetical protein VI363_08755, partial [Burkholderiales bacterium]
ALIVFIRPPMDVTILDYGRAPVFKVNGGDSEGNGADLEILGLLPVKTKLAYQADPGKYLFMSVGKNADFIAAEVLPDRTYYISILARSGVYPLKPADRQEQGSDEFRERLASAKWTTKGPDALTYAASRMTEIRARHIAGYRIWAQKGAAENPRLLPEHGATQAQ